MSGVPTNSRGFNGGTVTEPLAVSLAADANALDVFGAALGNFDLLKVASGGGATALEVFQAAGKAAGVYVATSDNGSIVLYVDGEASPSQTADVLRVVDKNGHVNLRVSANDGLGFFNHAAGAQHAAIADAAGGGVIDAEARTALNALLAGMRTLGLIAT